MSPRRKSLVPAAKDDELIEHSTHILLRYLKLIKTSILDSVHRMPPIMRLMFKKLKKRLEERWPGEQHEVMDGGDWGG